MHYPNSQFFVKVPCCQRLFLLLPQVTKRDSVLSFYSIPEYRQWQEATADFRQYKTKYYKVCLVLAARPVPFVDPHVALPEPLPPLLCSAELSPHLFAFCLFDLTWPPLFLTEIWVNTLGPPWAQHGPTLPSPSGFWAALLHLAQANRVRVCNFIATNPQSIPECMTFTGIFEASCTTSPTPQIPHVSPNRLMPHLRHGPDDGRCAGSRDQYPRGGEGVLPSAAAAPH